MSQQQTTCRACGCELAGRDVYEGICKRCREDEILGKSARARKPPRPQPDPAPAARPQPPADPVISQAPPPPDEPRVDMDADTKELVIVGEGPDDRSGPAAGQGGDAPAPSLDADTKAAPLVIDEEAELSILDASDHEPDDALAPPAVAIRVEEPDADPGYVLPLSDVSTGLLSADDAQPSAVTSPPQPLRILTDRPATPPAEPPSPGARRAPARRQPPAQPVEDEPPPPDLKLRLHHPAVEPAPSPKAPPATDEPEPRPPARLAIDTELDARFRQLEGRLAELAARIDALAEAQPSHRHGGSAVTFLVAVLAGLGALLLLGGGLVVVLRLLG